MRVSEADLLFIPGLGGSGPDHWQIRWSRKLSTGRTLELPDFERPSRLGWTQAITSAIQGCERPVVLLAHSLGVIAAVHAIASLGEGPDPGKPPKTPVRAAFFVAPPAPRTLLGIPAIDPAFAGVPNAPLPFPSLLVASRNDPYATMAESEGMALDWGAQIVDAGEAGHLNAESGHGPWPEGLMRFATFMARV
ncbi:MAG: RBBP9/YdeN family alpha/beta hydrolase [Beijerinckiaceae bacterium]